MWVLGCRCKGGVRNWIRKSKQAQDLGCRVWGFGFRCLGGGGRSIRYNLLHYNSPAFIPHCPCSAGKTKRGLWEFLKILGFPVCLEESWGFQKMVRLCMVMRPINKRAIAFWSRHGLEPLQTYISFVRPRSATARFRPLSTWLPGKSCSDAASSQGFRVVGVGWWTTWRT